jgi:hypothetical protein
MGYIGRDATRPPDRVRDFPFAGPSEWVFGANLDPDLVVLGYVLVTYIRTVCEATARRATPAPGDALAGKDSDLEVEIISIVGANACVHCTLSLILGPEVLAIGAELCGCPPVLTVAIVAEAHVRVPTTRIAAALPVVAPGLPIIALTRAYRRRGREHQAGYREYRQDDARRLSPSAST